MLLNIYGDVGKWDNVFKLKGVMRDIKFRKMFGCSMIEVCDEVIEFYSLDERYFEIEEIYVCLRSLIKLIRLFRKYMYG